MFGKRVQYGILLLGMGAYYVASGQWLAWILLLVTAGLPWLSLLLSLPAIFTFQAAPAGADILEMGEEADLWLLGSCRSPMPPFRGRIRVKCLLTGEQWRYSSEYTLPTDHCAGYRISLEKVRICDYLGLFSFRVRKLREQTVIVRPKPIPAEDMPDPRRREVNRWIPKPGGGFSENHEHRLYHPGDSLNQLHWKLSAKVGDLILREPMEPVQGTVLLTLSMSGSPDVLDRKLGRLLWVGEELLKQELHFEIRALTGQGILTQRVDSGEGLLKAVDKLLCAELAQEGTGEDFGAETDWQYHIGGNADET